MKTVAELNALKKKAQKEMAKSPDGRDRIRVVVGMATCGIAAGAGPILEAFRTETARRGLTNVAVVQTGCIGMCQYEPIAEVTQAGQEKVTYVKLTADMVPRIVSEHLVNDRPVDEFTVGAIAK